MDTFNGAAPYMNKEATRPIDITQCDEVQNFDQAGDLYQSFSQREQDTMVENLVASLGGAIPRLQKKPCNRLQKLIKNLVARSLKLWYLQNKTVCIKMFALFFECFYFMADMSCFFRNERPPFGDFRE